MLGHQHHAIHQDPRLKHQGKALLSNLLEFLKSHHLFQVYLLGLPFQPPTIRGTMTFSFSRSLKFVTRVSGSLPPRLTANIAAPFSFSRSKSARASSRAFTVASVSSNSITVSPLESSKRSFFMMYSCQGVTRYCQSIFSTFG